MPKAIIVLPLDGLSEHYYNKIAENARNAAEGRGWEAKTLDYGCDNFDTISEDGVDLILTHPSDDSEVHDICNDLTLFSGAVRSDIPIMPLTVFTRLTPEQFADWKEAETMFNGVLGLIKDKD